MSATSTPWAVGEPSTTVRVRWIPGTDQLVGTCHCGLEHETQDPIEIWDWLETHQHRDLQPS